MRLKSKPSGRFYVQIGETTWLTLEYSRSAKSRQIMRIAAAGKKFDYADIAKALGTDLTGKSERFVESVRATIRRTINRIQRDGAPISHIGGGIYQWHGGEILELMNLRENGEWQKLTPESWSPKFSRSSRPGQSSATC